MTNPVNEFTTWLDEVVDVWVNSNRTTRPALARRLDRDSAWLHRLCNGESTPALAELARLVQVLGIDVRSALRRYVDEMVKQATTSGDDVRRADWESLARGLFEFAPGLHLDVGLIIRGDRRDPQDTLAERITNAPSTIDLCHLGALGTPPMIVSDQILLTSSEQFRDIDWLSLGSPNVNLCTREQNEFACFRFDFDEEALKTYRRLRKLGTPPAGEDLNTVREQFKATGVIDPLRPDYRLERHCMAGLLTFAEHPRNPRQLLVIAAGTRGVATAKAVQLLADPDTLKRRPLGGVFEIASLQRSVQTIDMAQLAHEWVTPEYDINQYRDAASQDTRLTGWWDPDGARLVGRIHQRRPND